MHIFVFIRRMSIQEAILVVVTQVPYSRGKKKNLIDRVTSVAVPYDGLNEDYAFNKANDHTSIINITDRALRSFNWFCQRYTLSAYSVFINSIFYTSA